MKANLTVTIVVLFCNYIISQSKHSIELSQESWDTTKAKIAKYEVYNGKETLLLDGNAKVKNIVFDNGTIEVDVLASSSRSFAGITFRQQNKSKEEVYIRNHKSNQADALQYTPNFNAENNWQSIVSEPVFSS